MPDGPLEQQELYGPPSFYHWLRSFKVWMNTCLMLDLYDLGLLTMQESKIEGYHVKYGPEVWFLLYALSNRRSV